MLIQYHDHFDVVGDFDPESGRIQIRPRRQAEPSSGTAGWFSILEGTCVVFYRASGKLWLRVGDRRFDLDSGTSVSWYTEQRRAVFKVSDSSGDTVLRYLAGPRSGPPLVDDTTPFAEPEHWDLGLFVTNVLGDEERSHLLRSAAADSSSTPDIDGTPGT